MEEENPKRTSGAPHIQVPSIPDSQFSKDSRRPPGHRDISDITDG